MIEAVNAALAGEEVEETPKEEKVEDKEENLPKEEEKTDEKLSPGVFELEQTGARDLVKANISFNEDGEITEIVVEGERFSEKEENKTKELNDAFLAQFIEKKAPYILGENIDTISSATVTSQTVVNLANQAATMLAATVKELEEGGYEITLHYPGAREELTAIVQVSKEGIVKEVAFQGERFSEKEESKTKELNDSFIKQFIGQEGPFIAGENIDVISSATNSSRAAIEAVNIALRFIEK